VKPSFVVRLCALLFLLAPTVALASGMLRGIVTDSLTNEALVGAHLMITGTSLGAASDIQGNYAIRAIPAGRYTVKCSYIGYTTKSATVTITDDATTELNFAIVVTTVQGQEIVVTGQAVGQAAAINQQLTSNRIVNVISEQKIKELPDANAAEAIGRLPGVSVIRSGGEASQIVLRGLGENMTTITVDGVQLSATDADSRGVDLSTIAQGSLSGITLTKAITSDMDGQAIAGNVNFVTKSAPSTRTIQATAQGTYNGMDSKYGQFNVYGNYGERFFDDVFGVQVFGNMERRIRSNENFSVAYDQTLNHGRDWNISSFTVQYVPELRTRRGGKIILDANTPDNGVVKFAADVNRTDRALSIMNRNYPTESGEVNYEFTGQNFTTDILALSLQGENHVAGFQANWSLSFTQSQTDMPYDFELHFDEPGLLQNGVPISGMSAVPLSLRKGPYEALIPYALNNFNDAFIQYGYVNTSNSLELQKTALLDVKRDYTFSDFAGEVQFGGKYVSRWHRRYSWSLFSPYYNGVQFKQYMRNPDGSVVPKDFAGKGFGNLQQSQGLIFLSNFIGSNTRNIFGQYLLNPLMIADRMRDWYDISHTGYDPLTRNTEYSDDTQLAGTDYGAVEAVGSGYLMNTLNLGTFATLILGVRVEADNDNYQALYTPTVLTNYSVFRDTAATHTEAIVLPNAHLILKPTDFMNVRLAAYRGILRPDYSLRLPNYVMVGYAAYVNNWQLKVGNPDLKNADAWNYELNLQFYGEKIGLLSISGFYKQITNEVEYLNGLPCFTGSTIPDSMGVKYLNNQPPPAAIGKFYLYYPYNSSKPSKVWGFEAEQQVNFRYLPGLLSGITLSYNLSLVRNETWTPYGKLVNDTTYFGGFPIVNPRVVLDEQKTRISNAPQFFTNIVFGYDIDGFSARLSYFHQGEFYSAFSSDQRANTIVRQFERLDLSLKQEINSMLSVGLNLNNLTNTTEGTYLEDAIDGYRVETSAVRYGLTADLWLKVAL